MRSEKPAWLVAILSICAVFAAALLLMTRYLEMQKAAAEAEAARVEAARAAERPQPSDEPSTAPALADNPVTPMPISVASTPVTVAPIEEKPLWPPDAASFGAHHYKVFPQLLSWHTAQRRCREMGGRLACVHSAPQNAFIADLVRQAGIQDAWLGATDERQEGRWVWCDNSLMTYSNWTPTQPNNKRGLEHYVVLSLTFNAGWSDQPDESHQHAPGFVCEW